MDRGIVALGAGRSGTITGGDRRRRMAAGLARLWADMLRDFGRDFAAGRAFLWWPVAFGSAAAVYFALPFEPPLLAAAIPATALFTAAVVVRLTRAAVPALLVLAVCAAMGFLAARIQVDRAAAPVLAYARVVVLTGTVEAVEDRGSRGNRLRIAVEAMDPLPREGTPATVRVTVRSHAPAPFPGERITLRARLGPPQAPLYPGGYDFARMAYFAGIGGVGFAMGPVERAPRGDGAEPPPGARIGAAVERFRLAVSARIRETVAGDAGAIAAALLVGDRGAIDPATDDAMRVSGLSHVLSISGLHMALVAACLFGGLRALLALVPPIAERLPIKQVAAAVALAGTLVYLVIAGMGLATQRSAVMIAITLLAVMIGRQAFSLRNVAVAALVVLGLRPDAVLDPGAQLSFAAVTALIAGFEAFGEWRGRRPDAGDVNRVVRWALAVPTWIGLSMLTSLLAGVATTPVALHHFNRAAPLGLVANLLATPLVSFLIMPAGLVAALAMPLGLDHWPLVAMGAGIDMMVAIARTVADWTPGGGTMGRPALAGTLMMVAGGLWLCLWTGKARLPGFPLLAAGLALAPMVDRPDLVVAGDGRRAMLVLDDGRLVLLGRPDSFETAIWLAALGDPRRPEDPSLVAGVRCDSEACIVRDFGTADGPGGGGSLDRRTPEGTEASGEGARVAERVGGTVTGGGYEATERERRNDGRAATARAGGTVRDVRALPVTGRVPEGKVLAALIRRPEAFADECGEARLVIAAIPAPDWCRALTTVIDIDDLEPTGARTFRIEPAKEPADALPFGEHPTEGPADAPPFGGHPAEEPSVQATGTGSATASRPPDPVPQGWRLTELGRAIPSPRRPYDIGSP